MFFSFFLYSFLESFASSLEMAPSATAMMVKPLPLLFLSSIFSITFLMS